MVRAQCWLNIQKMIQLEVSYQYDYIKMQDDKSFLKITDMEL